MGRQVFLFILLAAAASLTHVEASYADGPRNSFSIQTGGAQNFNMPLKFEQGAYQEKITAEYSTRPFGPGAAPYYNLRYKRQMSSSILGLEDMFWSLDLLHHKVWLDNLPAAVSEFRMTFGYNLIPISFGARILSWLEGYVGVGPVVVHPVNTVNGLTLPNEPVMWPTGKRYTLVGAGVQAGAEASYSIWKNVFVVADVRFMFTKSLVPIVGGRARVLQASLHAHGGLGFVW
ncbi:hypothetical protein GW916_12630 [bacterium]|nr:hypothetical protein [bacterium]